MGSFVLKTAKDGQTYFNLKAANGEAILSSEMYKSKSGALNGIESVKTNAPLAERFEKKVSSNGKHYFVLKAGNHEIIGNSEMYESASSRDNGIQSVMKNAPTADTKDET
jgi:uncharacterized protein YegP (UPF0339 family)